MAEVATEGFREMDNQETDPSFFLSNPGVLACSRIVKDLLHNRWSSQPARMLILRKQTVPERHNYLDVAYAPTKAWIWTECAIG